MNTVDYGVISSGLKVVDVNSETVGAMHSAHYAAAAA